MVIGELQNAMHQNSKNNTDKITHSKAYITDAHMFVSTSATAPMSGTVSINGPITHPANSLLTVQGRVFMPDTSTNITQFDGSTSGSNTERDSATSSGLLRVTAYSNLLLVIVAYC